MLRILRLLEQEDNSLRPLFQLKATNFDKWKCSTNEYPELNNYFKQFIPFIVNELRSQATIDEPSFYRLQLLCKNENVYDIIGKKTEQGIQINDKVFLYHGDIIGLSTTHILDYVAIVEGFQLICLHDLPENINMTSLCNAVPFDRMLSSCERPHQLRKTFCQVIVNGEIPENQNLQLTEFQVSMLRNLVVNESQKQFLEDALTSTLPIKLLVGPPGTGKSYSIVQYINLLQHKIVCTAPTNVAVVNLLEKYISHGKRSFIWQGNKFRLRDMNLLTKRLELYHLDALVDRIVSVFFEFQSVNEKIMNECDPDEIRADIKLHIMHLKEILSRLPKCKIYDLYTQRLDRANSIILKPITADSVIVIPSTMHETIRKYCFKIPFEVVFCTVSRCSVIRNLPDHIIVDEACMVVESESTILFHENLQKLILVGDPMQLSSTVNNMEAKKYDFDKSLFDRLYSLNYPYQMLNIQYRMVPKICEIVSKLSYNNKLETGWLPPQLPWQNDTRFSEIQWINVESSQLKHQPSYSNEIEVDVIFKYLNEFFENYFEVVKSANLKIAIISPYRKQIEVIQQILYNMEIDISKHIECNSIDAFQGQERDIVIISLVRTQGLGFTGDLRRLNVAISRARFMVTIIGDAKNFIGTSWFDVFKYCQSFNAILS
eukprot:NODE_46_length_32145_cov_0.918711.p2 type:complete len:659 gc:universal NODE_46_length_32145_cov_0.918711:20455-22431(+)